MSDFGSEELNGLFYEASWLLPIDPLPLERYYLQKIPQTSQSVPLSGDQCSNIGTSMGAFFVQVHFLIVFLGVGKSSPPLLSNPVSTNHFSLWLNHTNLIAIHLTCKLVLQFLWLRNEEHRYKTPERYLYKNETVQRNITTLDSSRTQLQKCVVS